MDEECDGSGREQYYWEDGRKFLLCETRVEHKHCDCGMPISTTLSQCIRCTYEEAGQSLTAPLSPREFREHMDVALKVKLKGSASD